MEQARYYVCKSCYSQVPSGHKFCGKCGTPTEFGEEGLETDYYGSMQASGKAKLILIKGEGMDGISYHLNSSEHIAGRSEGAILFTEDQWLSPKHANFYYNEQDLFVRDEGSVNGIFYRIRGSLNISFGSTFMCGEQIFRIDQVDNVEEEPDSDGTYFYSSPKHESSFKIVQILEGGVTGMVVHAKENRIVVGREGCDMNFPNDPYISGHHVQIEHSSGNVILTDLDSKNGTFVKIDQEQKLGHGDYVFLGKQLLRVEITP